ncbi:MAG: FG-GAP-like repeat-containing protein, partial [Proteobacteria bacterium]|nr:FG-GAP-like repeat-containing protein [Pseudomonadota bacterium]
IGAPNSSVSAGKTYIVFGGSANLTALDALDTPTWSVNLANLNGTNGFAISGQTSADRLGTSVSGLGDVNGDGIDDIIVGAYLRDTNGNNSGTAYVVFGKAQGQSFAANLSAAGIYGSNGFAINGVSLNDQVGQSVSAAGDINGDGVADILIGGPYADSAGQGNRGAAYIVFGKPSGQSFNSPVELSALNGSNGFRLDSFENGSQTGTSVSAAGDVNGDGFADLIIGARFGTNSGSALVVFGGSAVGSGGSLDLSALSGANGFTAYDFEDNARIGSAADDAGRSVVIAGDINGDGLDDLIIGARLADPNSITNAGSTFVVFGQSAFGASVTLSTLANGTSGFRLDGIAANDQAGRRVAGGGDFNGDGFDDLVIGAPNTTVGTLTTAGSAYVVFGKASGFAAATTLNGSFLDGSNGFAVNGIISDGLIGNSIDLVGDLNGDGYDDLIVSGGYGGEGTTAVIFGGSSVGSSGSIALTALNGANGFLIPELSQRDYAGTDVSSAGDINGDGFDDLIVSASIGDGSNASNYDERGESYIIFGGDFSNAINFLGTSGADALTGGTGAEVFVAGQGNDVIVGGGGADVIKGGAGDDVFSVGDLTFQRIEGDAGTDTLQFSLSNTTIDLTTIANNRITGIEKIDLTGAGNSNNTLALSLGEVLAISDTSTHCS